MHTMATARRRRLIGVAHRFLPLPLAPEVLLEALTSLEELREVLDSPRLRDAIGTYRETAIATAPVPEPDPGPGT